MKAHETKNGRPSPAFVVLGVHGPDVKTVEGDMLRVRIFLDDPETAPEALAERPHVDEDFPLPGLHSSIPATEEIYAYMLQEKIEARRAELRRFVP